MGSYKVRFFLLSEKFISTGIIWSDWSGRRFSELRLRLSIASTGCLYEAIRQYAPSSVMPEQIQARRYGAALLSSPLL
jgi:hypothetical protein